MSQCRHALRQDIWQVMSLDGLWTQYTQADGYSHEGYAHRLKENTFLLTDFVHREIPCIISVAANDGVYVVGTTGM